MFPTTIWTDIRHAGRADPEALDRLARSYRGPMVRYLRRRGFTAGDADDICQDVFVRLLRGSALCDADRAIGRFRSLLLTVTTRAMIDFRRRRDRALPTDEIDPATDDETFDREWLVELVDRAFAEMERTRSPYLAVLRGHLGGQKQDRQKLWIARRKLVTLIRREIALTAATPADFEEELAHLSRFLGVPEIHDKD